MQTWLGGSTHITMTNFLETGLSKADILRFFEFSKWPPPPSWIVEFAKFYWLTVFAGFRRLEGSDASLYQISSKSVVPINLLISKL